MELLGYILIIIGVLGLIESLTIKRRRRVDYPMPDRYMRHTVGPVR